MKRYVSIIFSAMFFLMAFIPCQLLAASITEKRAAIGEDCVATGGNSTAMGYKSTASGTASTAMGYTSTASGTASTAMGESTLASGYASTAMGYLTQASGSFSFAGGYHMHLTDTAHHTFVWGYSFSEQPISTRDAFLIFPAGTKGKVGIGTANPREELEIYGDYPYVIFDGHSTSDARQIGVNNYGLAVYNSDDDRCDMVINNNGNVGIGSTNPSMKLYVLGSAGGTQAWNASDKREKTDIRPIRYALNNVSKLRGVAYKWKRGDEDESQGFDNKTHFGVIAQELEEVYPELVDNPGNTQKRKHVEYNGLIGVLIEAVKELKVQNEDQKAKIEAQQSQIKELRSLIQNLNG